MAKITLILFVILTTYSCYLAEARSSIEISEKIMCETGYYIREICGTDGETYVNNDVLECTQKKEYGKRLNLQFKHYGRCWAFEKYGLEPCTVFCVRNFRSNSILTQNTQYPFIFVSNFSADFDDTCCPFACRRANT